MKIKKIYESEFLKIFYYWNNEYFRNNMKIRRPQKSTFHVLRNPLKKLALEKSLNFVIPYQPSLLE